MIILRHNTLSAEDLFLIERIMRKVAEAPHEQHSLEYSLLNKSRGEVYGFIAGVFKRLGICQALGITISDFLDFLIDIEKGYNDNPYHSFYHAVDVAMVLNHMMVQYDMSQYITKIDLALIMIAALCHDIGHPGKNNQFEVACKTERAKKYHNLSVLECHSSALTLELIDKHHLFRHIETSSESAGVPLTEQEAKVFTIKMILATDMVCHFTLKDNISILHEKIDNLKEQMQVSEAFQNTVSIAKQERTLLPIFPEEKGPNPFNYFAENYFHTDKVPCLAHGEKVLLGGEERLMMCKILIHAADISNPCRPWPVFYQQSSLVCVEFFRQGEEELRLGLPVSPNMNPSEANPSSINVGFIDFIVQPYFEALASLFPKSKELVVQCGQNKKEWLKLSSQRLDILRNTLMPIEVALGPMCPIHHVTNAAGTVQIPDKFGKDIRNKLRRQSLKPTTTGTNWLVAVDEKKRLKLRRKSEEISLLHHRNPRSISSITKSRRKSDETSVYLNHPKMVSLSGYE
ncbi:hypothetical protein INT47_002435 [Mucor saturninus]|uniref:Phosphodiesterase n=1 Tax=Mucor saturninus TaxID=64648 RepID=A0A8H7RIY8_9FUNG|nr:hypothetical protein INT47_002435 [Mucor saturninus]